MKERRYQMTPLAVIAAIFACMAATTTAGAAGPVNVPLSIAGTTSFASAPYAGELDKAADQIEQGMNGDAEGAGGEEGFGGVNRTLVGAKKGKGRSIPSSAKAKSDPQLGTHFQGLNFHDQRFANGGNQFSVEPPTRHFAWATATCSNR